MINKPKPLPRKAVMDKKGSVTIYGLVVKQKPVRVGYSENGNVKPVTADGEPETQLLGFNSLGLYDPLFPCRETSLLMLDLGLGPGDVVKITVEKA